MCAAILIGLGGAGIQTLARLGALPRSSYVGTLGEAEFLGIDGVTVDLQSPTLPASPPWIRATYLNLTAEDFIPSAYLRTSFPADPELQRWWDETYTRTIDYGPVTQGLKAQRMLGHLAVYRMRDEVRSAVRAAASRALTSEVARQLAHNERLDTPPSIPVLIVCSAMGGTGSAAFLEIALAIWQASAELGVVFKVRPFIFLPSILRPTAIAEHGPSGPRVVEVHAANTYAFFREIDHFCRFSSHLGRYFGRPFENGGPDIPDGLLLDQIYVIANSRAPSQVGSIAAAYDTAAEMILRLASDRITSDRTWTGPGSLAHALTEFDEYDKPRRYCRVEIAQVGSQVEWAEQELAVTAHAIEEISSCHDAYRRRCIERGRVTSVPPTHVDQRFEQDLQDLAPPNDVG